MDTWNNQDWTIIITWDNHYSLFCVKGLNEDSFLVFQILLVYFSLFPNPLSWIVPVARIIHSFKILIKERDENQLLKKTSLLPRSSILVTQSKTEQKKIFFLNPCLVQIFSTSRINKVRLAIIWAHNKVFVTQSDALSSYYLFATVFAQYMALSAHWPSNVCVKSQIFEDFCLSYHKACKLLSKIFKNLLFRFK